jgi:hypothetical protein
MMGATFSASTGYGSRSPVPTDRSIVCRKGYGTTLDKKPPKWKDLLQVLLESTIWSDLKRESPIRASSGSKFPVTPAGWIPERVAVCEPDPT